MTEHMKEIKDLSDNIETTVDHNEIKNAQDVLRDPQQKKQMVDYLEQNKDKL